MTPQGLAKLKKLEREMRKLRNETEDIHGQIRDLLWSEEEDNQQLDGDKVWLNDKKSEAIKALSEWADEDKEHRSVIIVAGCEIGTHVAYNGADDNQVAALQEAICRDGHIEDTCAKALRSRNLGILSSRKQ